MGCCGKNTPRNKAPTRTAYPNPPRATMPAQPAALTQPPVAGGTFMEYVGPTRMMVRGPVSGRVYRFAKSRVSVLIDARDAPLLLAVPNLRLVAASAAEA
jgi:hypothetical protein